MNGANIALLAPGAGLVLVLVAVLDLLNAVQVQAGENVMKKKTKKPIE